MCTLCGHVRVLQASRRFHSSAVHLGASHRSEAFSRPRSDATSSYTCAGHPDGGSGRSTCASTRSSNCSPSCSTALSAGGAGRPHSSAAPTSSASTCTAPGSKMTDRAMASLARVVAMSSPSSPSATQAVHGVAACDPPCRTARRAGTMYMGSFSPATMYAPVLYSAKHAIAVVHGTARPASPPK